MSANPHRTASRLLGAALASLLLSLASSFLLTPSASAFAVQDRSGTTGKVAYAGPVMSAVGDTHDAVEVVVEPLTVGRAYGSGIPEDGHESLQVSYSLERRAGTGWVSLTRVSLGRLDLAPGGSVPLAGWSFPVPDSDSLRHEYRVTVSVVWVDVNTNFFLGSLVVVPGPYGDARCETDTDRVPCDPTLTGGLLV